MQFKQKPNTLVCYICGREFGTKSLQIHLKSCQAKYQQEQSLKDKKDRKTIPPQPPLLRELLNGNLENLQIYNQQATQIHKYQVLPSCKFCGRTFNEESLKSHMNACPKKTNIEPTKKTYEEDIKKPRTLACCVCGREFGLTSLKIHYPQCLEKFENEQSKKPKEQRRKAPTFSSAEIDLFENKTEWSQEQIQAFNQKAMSMFREKGMIHCEMCKRSFMPEPYQKHLRNCKQNNKNFKEPPKAEASYAKEVEFKKPKVLLCHICGRQFGLTSLAIHQKTCAEKFVNSEKLKPKFQRKPLPVIPPSVQANFPLEESEKWPFEKIEEYNKICNQIYRNQSMVECHLCKRKFIEAAYLKHKNYCEKNNKPVQQVKPEPPIIQVQRKVAKQKTKEIKVDNVIPQTAEQFQETVVFQNLNNQVPAQQQNSQKMSPRNNKKVIESEKDISKDNKEEKKVETKVPEEIKMEKKVSQEPKNPEPVMKNESQLIEQSLQLHPCEKCGRKFLAQRLEKHISVCKGTKTIPNFKQKLANKSKQTDNDQNYRSQRVQSKKMIEQQQAPENHSKQLAPCSKCGRRFLENRLSKHQECCKGKQNASVQQAKQVKIQKTKETNKNIRQTLQKPNEKMPPKHEQKPKQVAQPDNIKEGQSYQHVQLKPCSKCDRKFAIDRLEVHQNICKGKPKLKMELPEKAKTIEVIKKTKENFFKMVQDIKSKKIKDEEIDKQLEEQLQTLANEQHRAGGLKSKKENINHQEVKQSNKQVEIEKVAKWKKGNIAKRSPSKQMKKQGRNQSHLPKI